ncbi:hypothetical protein [Dehalococcoides mccartyi]|uniref:Uncharacterized protein n=1 Tax=Dehalococcoides mccartyi (strain ATCC BAA-2266 / KCTC 15142 / 195) TaxID=243164 RepID=Q3ZA37_DEHM1|nr:hypothetical protein [Dehalococcoides mccartyi]AAW40599.1 hypothetical protein DET0164 [Dehalococcoides mccartyi 195]
MAVIQIKNNCLKIIDNQVRELVSAIELGPKWLEEVLSIISMKDDVERIHKERDEVKARLLRLGRAYVDNVMPEEEYKQQKRLLDLSLESLVVPDYNAAEVDPPPVISIAEM